MKWLIRKCPKCKTYTLRQNCPNCGETTISPQPARFSPNDKYSKLRQPQP